MLMIWTTAGPGEPITAVAVSPVNDQAVLAAGETGVWQTLDGGGTWTRVSATQLRRGLSIAPNSADTVYGISSDARSILKSTDGGMAWTSVFAGTGQTQINTVLADPNLVGAVYAGVSYTDGLAQVLRSMDAGATWAPVLPPNLRGAGGIGSTNITTLAALRGVGGLVLAGIQVYHGGGVLRSTDNGTTWISVYQDNLTPLAAASALAVAGDGPAATIYAGFNVMQFGSLVRSTDGGSTWSNLSANLPIHGADGGVVSNLDTNPVQAAWVYMSEWNTAPIRQTGVFATPDAGATWVELGHLEAQVNGPQGLALAISSRTLYAATEAGVFQYTIGWPVLPRFAGYYDASDGPRLLGTAISLGTEVNHREPNKYGKEENM